MSVVDLSYRNSREARSIGLDAVRAIAAILVVYLHACIPYLVQGMPGIVWPATDSPSRICNALFWAIEVFVMPLFLVISGYYAHRALVASDHKSFLKSRANRLLRPLVFGMLVVLPMDLYIWLIGLVAEGLIPASKLRSLKLPAPYNQIWGFSHLWFLHYVFSYAAILAGLNLLVRNRVPMRWRPTLRRLSAVAVAVVGILTLIAVPKVVFGFQHAFLPVFSKWLYSGTFFAGGVAFAVFDPKFRTLNRLAVRNLAIGTIATIAAVLLACWTLWVESSEKNNANINLLISLTLAATTVLAAWGITMGVIGFANRSREWLWQRERTCLAIQYLSNASFWIYLVHHPIVGLVQIDLKWLAPLMLPLTKSVIAASVATGLGLISYEWMVRTTGFGRLIGLTGQSKSIEKTRTAGDEFKKQKNAIRIAA